MAKDVNFVWNYCNELSYKHLRRTGKFMSAYDFQPYTKGSSKDLAVNAQTVQRVAAELAARRRQFKKAKLRWRGRRSLGWIPFQGQQFKCGDGYVRYNNHTFQLWDHRGLSKYKPRDGCFAQDARGRWYVCIPVEVDATEAKAAHRGTAAVGIDLGLKTFATLSDGRKFDSPRAYCTLQAALGIAQRAGNRSRVRAIHAKIKNVRLDALHKLSTAIVREHAAIFVGDVSSSRLAKTSMAKSVLDAGWSSFRAMLRYKCEYAGVMYAEVDEKNTTQVCSCCAEKSASSPKGRTGLRMREWTCAACGAQHDRDVNSAKNILARGHAGLVGGIRTSQEVR